jgi:hypothetical protein
MNPKKPRPTTHYQLGLFDPSQPLKTWERLPRGARQEALRLLANMLREYPRPSAVSTRKGVRHE